MSKYIPTHNMYIGLQTYIYTPLCVCAYVYTRTRAHPHARTHIYLQKNVTFTCSKGSQRVQNPGFMAPTHGKTRYLKSQNSFMSSETNDATLTCAHEHEKAGRISWLTLHKTPDIKVKNETQIRSFFSSTVIKPIIYLWTYATYNTLKTLHNQSETL